MRSTSEEQMKQFVSPNMSLSSFQPLMMTWLLSGKELNDYISANPSKSIYCFTLNRKKPGHFNIVFKANPASPVQVWV